MGLFRDLLRQRAGDLRSDDPLTRARRDVSAFCEACLMHAEPPTPERPTPRYGLFLFVAGAVRYATAQHHLDERDAAALLSQAVVHLGGEPADAARILEDMIAGSYGPPGRSALDEGVNTFRDWVQGQDNGAPMRLGQLLREW